ncbi:MAG: IS110 family transposase [Nitrospirae bacterium]|nr:IS110 family transposase [Nitrospirota bacterium]
MEPYKQQWGLLQIIPCVDEITAAMLLAEIGTDMSVFGSKDKICSWAGICPGNNESAKEWPVKQRKPIRQLLCESANSAIKTKSQFNGMEKGTWGAQACYSGCRP